MTLQEKSYIEGCYAWKDVSHYFSINIIGKKLIDIIINKTNKVYFPCFTIKREDGEDLYDEIIFVFENNVKLVVELYAVDYMGV